MEYKEVSDTTESEVPESSDKLGFGGWLRFFQVMNIISVVIVVLLLLLVASELLFDFLELGNDIEMYTLFIEVLIVLSYSTATLKILKIQNQTIPQTLNKYLTVYFIASMLMFGINLLLYYYDYLEEKPESISSDIFYYLIWIFYFKKSKRVNEYYGANAR